MFNSNVKGKLGWLNKVKANIDIDSLEVNFGIIQVKNPNQPSYWLGSIKKIRNWRKKRTAITNFDLRNG